MMVTSNATATVNIRSDYYAFGLQHPTGNIVPTPKNRYLYLAQGESKETACGS